MTIKLDSEIIRNPNIVTRIINSKALLVNYENNELFWLNSSGIFLWDLLSKSIQIEILIKKFQRKYQVNFQSTKQEVVKFISNLFKEQFIIFSKQKKFLKRFPPSFSDKLWDKIQPIAEKEKFPALAEIEIIDQCNLSCIHCYVTKKKKTILSFIEVKSVISQLEKAGCFFLTFTGGEPFLRKDFLKIIYYAEKKGFSIDILSNGTLITSSVAKEIAKLKVNRIQISVYSAIPIIHDSVTKINGSFRKSKSAIKLLRDNKVKVHLACLVMSLNFSTYKTVGDLAKETGASWSVAYPVRARHSGEKDTYRLRLNKQQLKQFVIDNEKEVCQYFIKEFNNSICHAGLAICFISAIGGVTPCVLFPMQVGNLHKERFIKIWRKSFLLNNFRVLTISDLPKCKSCKFLEFCRVCPGLNYLEEGNVFKSAKINCQFARVTKQILEN